ncbi:uncharacterized protein [Macrobrachium rosenbergii]|uniref:uncharacterized protein isoform X1 n=1 Tax=Macrobrachium rosenbergii TaxID=79674 RepID=UPI0034D4647F
MMSKKLTATTLLTLVVASVISSTLAASMDAQDARKFHSKPNNVKKQQLVQPDVKQDTPAANGGGFQWGDILGVLVQLLIGGPVNGGPQGASDKMDYITQLTTGEFSWSKVFSLGLQLVLNVLGGGDNAAIDKMDAGSPLEGLLTHVISYLTGSTDPNEVGIMAKQASEVLNLVVTLLDALRTSFSKRSFEARSLGSTDPLADAAVAATTMLKSYIKTYETEDDLCMQKYLCEANSDCVDGTGDTGYLFCQMGTYGLSYVLERTTYTPFEIYNDAGRRGRIGESCIEIFNECNEAV